MDIAELLNPAVETHNVFDASNEDILGAVMDAKKVGKEVVMKQTTQQMNQVQPAGKHFKHPCF